MQNTLRRVNVQRLKAQSNGSWFLHYFPVALFGVCLVLGPSRFLSSLSLFDLGGRSKDSAIPTDDAHNVHYVVSHCDGSIAWIWEKLAKETDDQARKYPSVTYRTKSVTFISKCNNTIPNEDLVPNESGALVQVVKLPNVGRNDQSFAYFIKEVLKQNLNNAEAKGTQEMRLSKPVHKLLYSNHKSNDCPFHNIAQNIHRSDLVLFMKDTDNSYRNRSAGWGEDSSGMYDTMNMLTIETPATTYEELKESRFLKPISRGVACQARTNEIIFARSKRRAKSRVVKVAHRAVLWQFILDEYTRLERDFVSGFKAEYRPMGSWINHLSEPQIDSDMPAAQSFSPQTVFSTDYYDQVVAITDFRGRTPERKYDVPDLAPVCWGGVFATFWGQVASDDAPLTLEGWDIVSQALSRGDNIEEGHYMERWWGDLLSWSSWADNRVSSSSDVRKDGQETSPFNKGVALPEEERKLMLAEKLRHMKGNHVYAGLVILDKRIST